MHSAEAVFQGARRRALGIEILSGVGLHRQADDPVSDQQLLLPEELHPHATEANEVGFRAPWNRLHVLVHDSDLPVRWAESGERCQPSGGLTARRLGRTRSVAHLKLQKLSGNLGLIRSKRILFGLAEGDGPLSSAGRALRSDVLRLADGGQCQGLLRSLESRHCHRISDSFGNGENGHYAIPVLLPGGRRTAKLAVDRPVDVDQT